MAPSELAERHRSHAAQFSRVVDAVTSWDVPSPVVEWSARQVVSHLTTWFPAFLTAGSGIELPPGPSSDRDPAGAWAHQCGAVQALLDDPATESLEFTNPNTGAMPLTRAIDQFYVNDVFMHAWDLARATGQPDPLDPTECEQMLAGMEPIEPMLRASGQFGQRQSVADDAPSAERLMAFLGRDPSWRPPV